MRTRTVIGLAAAVVICGVAALLVLAPGVLRGLLGEVGAGGPPNSAELESLLEGLERHGFGQAPHGIVIEERGEGGAVFTLQSGRTVTIAPPPETRLVPEFIVLGPRQIGFLLEQQDGTQVYVNSIDLSFAALAQQEQEGDAFYANRAEQIEQAGQLPFLDGMAQVVSVETGADHVRFCLSRADGAAFEGGVTYVGAVTAMVMRAGSCAEDGVVAARLSLAAEALELNR
ncbi:MAG: hypothetical protein ACFBSD_11715 [Paracoccaceae bacterium]